MTRMDLPAIIDGFTRGFAHARSITHPYVVERLGPLWVCRDGERRDPRKERNREYIVHRTPAAEASRRIAASEPRGYVVCVAHERHDRDADLEASWKARGYRYGRSEPFFVKAIPPVPRGPVSLPVRRVRRPEQAQRIAQAAGRRQIAEDGLGGDDPVQALFAAYDGDAVAGWVSSVRTDPTTAWVANLYVRAPHRGRGVGHALTRAMLRHDAKRGVTRSVLTASTAGSRLYRRLGYEQAGSLAMFFPPRDGDGPSRAATP